nr:copia protein [Tanacetum cinerariifolium]
MLADAKLSVTFWAEAVNTACYVQNRVLVNKSNNKTPYELLNGRSPAIGFLKLFGCHVMILNTLDNLGKFEKKGMKTLVACLKGVRPIGTKWVLKNKKDERGIVIRNKARLVAQGHTQEEGIDYDEVFAPVARIEAIRLFLAYASFIGFTVYQMDVKSAFLYGIIDEEVSLNTPMDKENPWGKDRTGKDVDLHLYRSMIRSLMYLTASRPDIMFAICAYARHQVEHAMRGFVKGNIIIYTFLGLIIDARFHTAKTLDLVWMWLGEKSEHNTDFHHMVDFIEASPLRIETMDEGTQILATVD